MGDRLPLPPEVPPEGSGLPRCPPELAQLLQDCWQQVGAGELHTYRIGMNKSKRPVTMCVLLRARPALIFSVCRQDSFPISYSCQC